MATNAGEMPFLDHLEELRKRILLSIAAIMVGFGVGWWLTTHFNLIDVVEAPVAPYVAGGKLTVLTLTSPFMIALKFAFILGVVLASPFVVYQLWLFLSPALTQREKRAIVPALGIGFVLFAAGVAIGWVLVVPPGVEWLATFMQGTFVLQLTYDSYMTLVVHLLVGMGIAAELPLVMILLSMLGILSYRVYNKFRRYAVLGAFIGGAILAPTPEISMMILFTIPLLLLYEVGVAGAWLVEKRRARAARITAGLVLLALCLSPRGLHAQFPPPASQGPPGAADPNRRITGQNLQRPDSGMLKRLGLPSAPTHKFASPDDIMQALLAREGFATTRFAGDSVRYVVTDEQIVLGGHAATLRSDGQLEADRILYDNPNHKVIAEGDPRFFDKGQSPMVGRTLIIDIGDGTERAVIDEAYTSLAQNGTNWFMRGNLAVDSGGKRLFGKNTEFTSCDIPDPHYHFVAGEVKWMSQSMIVARPAVLYIRDVPVAWLPFIFQDTKRDRASGILIPRFGFNDIVRTNRTYNRTVSNVGYYWAPNDYIDATASLDWYANRYIQYTGHLNYRWLDRFVTGSITLSKQI
ncbi:MAG: twin-arginine translocase subunit TatC, partial [Gemmatimonadota bacterium]